MNDLTLTLMNQIGELEKKIAALELEFSNLKIKLNPGYIPPPIPTNGYPSSSLHENTSAEVIADLRRQIDEKDKIIKEQEERIERLSTNLMHERAVTEYQREAIDKFKSVALPENNRQWWQFKGWD